MFSQQLIDRFSKFLCLLMSISSKLRDYGKFIEICHHLGSNFCLLLLKITLFLQNFQYIKVKFLYRLPETRKWPKNKRIDLFCFTFLLTNEKLSFIFLACPEEILINSKIFLKEDGRETTNFLKFLLSCTIFSRPTPNIKLAEMRKPGSLS